MKPNVISRVFTAVFSALALTFASISYASELSDAEITALIEGDLKVASKTIQKELKQTPNDAQLHKIAGDVFAVRAQDASLFSAPGLAKKTLKSYKKAVELAPENTNYRMSLMQFYLFAPGIVGGSKKLGAEQAEKINQLDPVSGVVADSFLLLNKKDKESLDALFSGLSPELLSNPRVKMAKANYLRSTDQFDQALELLSSLTELPTATLPEDQKLLPYRAMMQIGFIGLNSETHQATGLKSFKRYLDTAPATYKLTSKKWVSLFLGRLYAAMGDSEMAKTTLIAAKKLATDKNLISEIDKTLDELK